MAHSIPVKPRNATFTVQFARNQRLVDGSVVLDFPEAEFWMVSEGGTNALTINTALYLTKERLSTTTGCFGPEISALLNQDFHLSLCDSWELSSIYLSVNPGVPVTSDESAYYTQHMRRLGDWPSEGLEPKLELPTAENRARTIYNVTGQAAAQFQEGYSETVAPASTHFVFRFNLVDRAFKVVEYFDGLTASFDRSHISYTNFASSADAVGQLDPAFDPDLVLPRCAIGELAESPEGGLSPNAFQRPNEVGVPTSSSAPPSSSVPTTSSDGGAPKTSKKSAHPAKPTQKKRSGSSKSSTKNPAQARPTAEQKAQGFVHLTEQSWTDSSSPSNNVSASTSSPSSAPLPQRRSLSPIPEADLPPAKRRQPALQIVVPRPRFWQMAGKSQAWYKGIQRLKHELDPEFYNKGIKIELLIILLYLLGFVIESDDADYKRDIPGNTDGIKYSIRDVLADLGYSRYTFYKWLEIRRWCMLIGNKPWTALSPVFAAQLLPNQLDLLYHWHLAIQQLYGPQGFITERKMIPIKPAAVRAEEDQFYLARMMKKSFVTPPNEHLFSTLANAFAETFYIGYRQWEGREAQEDESP
ncbi:hypothetical protein SISNIDRAFT_468219 [Sistotremastrum niveocremeum HHB9708]|uniref:Uncharacterized protein n=1 Tax=Sistotremastrum niveocremeum HHB9708 TaxID=1314777 RepID=A0A164RXY7_9AGAM|nr:hypothetical protein SISNIDRAFT_468219 [Sistotremastrum niveocremeum HHB9708]